MTHALYDALAPYYDLVDPVDDHAEEAACYLAALERHAGPAATTLLELGAGGGHNAHFLKARFACTLTDVAPAMLARSGRAHPELEHVLGDMRTLDLGRTFDTVFAHDALGYLLTEADLRATFATAFAHLRPGGVALFAPDFVRETHAAGAELLASEVAGRSMRGLEWVLPLASPDATTYRVEYAFVFRDGERTVHAHDSHLEGLFDRATWLGLLADVGFDTATWPRHLDDREDELFVGIRPR